MLGARAALNYEIARTAARFRIPKLYAYTIIALVLIAIFNKLVTWGESLNRAAGLNV